MKENKMSKSNEVKNGAERDMKKDCFAYKMGFIASGVVMIAALLELVLKVITGESIIGVLFRFLGSVIIVIAFYISKKKYLENKSA